MHLNEISKNLKTREKELYDQNYWQLSFDQNNLSLFTGAGEQKGKVMKQQIIKISLKALQMLFKAKTQLGTK